MKSASKIPQNKNYYKQGVLGPAISLTKPKTAYMNFELFSMVEWPICLPNLHSGLKFLPA